LAGLALWVNRRSVRILVFLVKIIAISVRKRGISVRKIAISVVIVKKDTPTAKVAETKRAAPIGVLRSELPPASAWRVLLCG